MIPAIIKANAIRNFMPSISYQMIMAIAVRADNIICFIICLNILLNIPCVITYVNKKILASLNKVIYFLFC